MFIIVSGLVGVNTSPEFKGIKTTGTDGTSVSFGVNTSPEFKGIKTTGTDGTSVSFGVNTSPEFKGIKTINLITNNKFRE